MRAGFGICCGGFALAGTGEIVGRAAAQIFDNRTAVFIRGIARRIAFLIGVAGGHMAGGAFFFLGFFTFFVITDAVDFAEFAEADLALAADFVIPLGADTFFIIGDFVPKARVDAQLQIAGAGFGLVGQAAVLRLARFVIQHTLKTAWLAHADFVLAADFGVFRRTTAGFVAADIPLIILTRLTHADQRRRALLCIFPSAFVDRALVILPPAAVIFPNAGRFSAVGAAIVIVRPVERQLVRDTFARGVFAVAWRADAFVAAASVFIADLIEFGRAGAIRIQIHLRNRRRQCRVFIDFDASRVIDFLSTGFAAEDTAAVVFVIFV